MGTVRLVGAVQSRLAFMIKLPERGQIGYFFSAGGAAGAAAGAAGFASGAAVLAAGFFVSPQPMTATADTNSTIANNFFIALVS